MGGKKLAGPASEAGRACLAVARVVEIDAINVGIGLEAVRTGIDLIARTSSVIGTVISGPLCPCVRFAGCASRLQTSVG
jgi:hypothetical protein